MSYKWGFFTSFFFYCLSVFFHSKKTNRRKRLCVIISFCFCFCLFVCCCRIGEYIFLDLFHSNELWQGLEDGAGKRCSECVYSGERCTELLQAFSIWLLSRKYYPLNRNIRRWHRCPRELIIQCHWSGINNCEYWTLADRVVIHTPMDWFD